MCDKRLAVDDLVAQILQDGTFRIGRIPKQNTLGIQRQKVKCHDHREEDFPSDPLYRNILVKLYPNDGQPTDLLPKDLVILDRNMKVGQLVKMKGFPLKTGYVGSINQTASARLYQPDPEKRNDPLQELYMYKKPMSFFEETSKHSNLEIGDSIMVDGWIGTVTKVIRNVTIQVDFKNGTAKYKAHIVQPDLLLCMIRSGLSTMETGSTAVCHFGINGLDGIFPGRAMDIPLKNLADNNDSFKWSSNVTNVPRPADRNILVGVTVEFVMLHLVSVDWQIQVNQNANRGRPPTNLKNDFTRARIEVVSHAKPLKVGDVRFCNMTDGQWSTVLGVHAWRSCLAKDYYLHKRRDKRPRLDEDAKEILPHHRPKQVAVEILTTTSLVDVYWTDGSVERGIDSRKLDPVRYKKHFPGAIIFAPQPGAMVTRFTEIEGLGRELRSNSTYHVVESSLIKEVNFKDRSKWTIRSYQIPAGGVEPTAQDVRELTLYKTPIPMFSFWKHDQPQVVVKRRNSTANFTYGCVIGMFPDGRTRIRNHENGAFISVWPTDLVAANPDWKQPSQYLFECYKF